jgi:hypothetical protein
MTLEMIRKLLHGSERFTLRLVSGRAIEVPHPDFVALAPSETALIIAKTDSGVQLVRINQIERADTAEMESA